MFRMNALSDALPKIDFGYYRKMVSDPTLVDKLQKEVRNDNSFIEEKILVFSMKMLK